MEVWRDLDKEGTCSLDDVLYIPRTRIRRRCGRERERERA